MLASVHLGARFGNQFRPASVMHRAVHGRPAAHSQAGYGSTSISMGHDSDDSDNRVLPAAMFFDANPHHARKRTNETVFSL